MKSRLFLSFAMFALLGCLVQLRATDLRDAMETAHGMQPAVTAALGTNDFSLPIVVPPIFPIIENGVLSLVINPSALTKAGPSSKSKHGGVTVSSGNNNNSNAVQPRAVTLPIKMSDVTGLNSAVSQINSSLDTLNTTVSNLSTTVSNLNTTVTNLSATVNTTSTQLQNLVPVPHFVDLEMPTGSINGSNPVFVLSVAPSPPSSLILYKNGLKMLAGGDYSLSGHTILFASPSIPQTGDVLAASYRY